VKSLFLAGVGAGLIVAAISANVPARTVTADRILDGDTAAAGGLRIRLTGYDAPEIFHPRCPAELALGLRAKARAAVLLHDAQITIVPCAGWNYGRACGTVPGLAATMIREGLAIPYDCRNSHCPHTPANAWCH